jgi:hypothetical protein
MSRSMIMFDNEFDFDPLCIRLDWFIIPLDKDNNVILYI